MPLGDDALALGGVRQHAVRRAASSCQSATRRDRERAGGEEAMPFGEIAEASPCAVILALAQIEAAPPRRSSRQTMRRSGRTQVKWLVPPQRIDLGQGNRRSSGGIAAAIRRAAGSRLLALLQHPEIALAPQLVAGRAVLAQEAGDRLLRRIGARAALGRCVRAATAGIDLGRERDPARAVRRRATAAASSAAAASRPGASDPQPRAPASARGSLREQSSRRSSGAYAMQPPLRKPVLSSWSIPSR